MNCHICNTVITDLTLKRPWKPDFTCTHCYAAKETLIYCVNCWWWECGPMPAAAAIPPRVKASDEAYDLKSPCPYAKGKNEGQLATATAEREDYYEKIKAGCPEIRAKENDGLGTKIRNAFLTYDSQYYQHDKIDAELELEKSRRRMIYPIIATYLSSHYICRDITNHKVHLWDMPIVAEKHLQVCFFAIEHAPGVPFIQVGDRPIAQAALVAYEIIERILKDKLSIAQSHKAFNDLRIRFNLSHVNLKYSMEIAIMLFHSCSAKRNANDHWDWIDPHVADPTLIDKKTFIPEKASGFFGGTFKESIFENEKFTGTASKKLGNVYASLCVEEDIRPDNRFLDGAVDNLTGVDGVLSDKQAAYLKSMPNYKSVGGQVANASLCEKNIRTRIKKRLNRLLNVINDQRNIYIQESIALRNDLFTHHVYEIQNQLPDPLTQLSLGGIKFDLNFKINKYQQAINKSNWIARQFSANRQARYNAIIAGRDVCQTLLTRADQLIPKFNSDIYIPGKVFTSTQVLDLFLNNDYPRTVKSADQMDAILDALINDFISGTHWLEHTAHNGVFNGYANAVDKAEFKFQSYSEQYQEQISWGHVFPLCPNINPGNTVGTFTGMNFNVEENTRKLDGREKSWPWYMDWRVEKDRYIYDYFDFLPNELPNFSSFTHWKWNERPNPYGTYGPHMILLDSNKINLNRCVFTMMDKGHPRRSPLLLLQDLFCSVADKYGNPAPTFELRYSVIIKLLMHITSPNRAQPTTAELKDHWRTLGGNINPITFNEGNLLTSVNNMLPSVECHMFGPVKLTDAIGIFAGRKYYDVGSGKFIENDTTAAQMRDLRDNINPGWILHEYHNDSKVSTIIDPIRCPMESGNILGPRPTNADLN